jgi:ketosteroid isomerase-like protein
LRTRIPILAIALWFTAAPLPAQTVPQGAAPATERMHEELRTLRDGLVKATNEGNIEALLTHLHANVVVTWQNAEVSRGHAGVREYLQRMTSGPNARVRSFRTTPTVDELTILYGGENVGVAFGSSHDVFDLTDGSDFELNGRWSATLVREGNRWLVANFHASTNLFDNPLLNMTKRGAVVSGAGGLLVGAAVGLGAFLLMRRRRARAV